MKRQAAYFISSMAVAIFFAGSALASYEMVKEFEEKETRLKIEELSPQPEENFFEAPVKEEPAEKEWLIEREWPEEEGIIPEKEFSPEEEAFPPTEIPIIEEGILEPLKEISPEKSEKHAEIQRIKNNSYYLGADDVIKVSVLRHPEFSGEFVVEPNGYISVPYLDPVKAEGLTKYQLRDRLTAVLSDFIEKPTVDVRITEYKSQFIYVVGAVNRPGKYSTQGKKMTVRDAITAAEMPSRGASLRYAYVFSPDPDVPKKTVKLYDLMYRGKMEDNIELKSGEIIYIRATVISKLGGFLEQLLNPVERATAIKYIQEAY